MYYTVHRGSRFVRPYVSVAPQSAKTFVLQTLLVVLLVFLGQGIIHSLFAKGVSESSQNHSLKSPPSLLPKSNHSPLPPLNFNENTSTELEGELESWIKRQTGSEWAFYVESLDDETLQVQVNPDAPFYMASLYKLFLLQPLERHAPAALWNQKNLGSQSYAACVDKMLRYSDNPCAESFAELLDWNQVQQQLVSEGYVGTSINNAQKFNTTARDVGTLLKRLSLSNGLSKTARSIVFDAMRVPKQAEAIRNACPGCEVMNKTGELNGVKHDAAIVEKGGKVYVVVIMSQNAPWADTTEAASQIYKFL